jgi:hypothetical protein
VSYGENIEALVAYFYTRQYLPFARLKETLNDAFGVPIVKAVSIACSVGLRKKPLRYIK